MPRDTILGKALPTTIGSYRVIALLKDSVRYADYRAEHRFLGHGLRLRHERWPGELRNEGDVAPAVETLKRARRLQAEIRHPNILPVVDFFQHEGEWFTVVYEEPDAISLSKVCGSIHSGKRPQMKLLEYLQLCQGLTEAIAEVHRRGYIHQTINQGNILLDSSSRPILADMGCATPKDVQDETSTAARFFLVPFSAAPEQLDSEGALSQAVDIWSLGVVLFFVLYNRHPFARSFATSSEFLVAIASGDLSFPDPPPETNPDHHVMLRPWLTRMLERDPSKRPQDATQVHRDLKAIVAKIENRPPEAKAFVAMPFSRDLGDLWRSIEAICLDCRVQPVRVDEAITNENIWDEIRDELDGADLMIAVVSPGADSAPNPNVMLEIGYMRALKRPILILTGDPETLPFDLRTHRAVVCPSGGAHDAAFHNRLASLLRRIVDRTGPAPDEQREGSIR